MGFFLSVCNEIITMKDYYSHMIIDISLIPQPLPNRLALYQMYQWSRNTKIILLSKMDHIKQVP